MVAVKNLGVRMIVPPAPEEVERVIVTERGARRLLAALAKRGIVKLESSADELSAGDVRQIVRIAYSERRRSKCEKSSS